MIKFFKILVWARIRCDLHCVNSVKSTRIQTGIPWRNKTMNDTWPMMWGRAVLAFDVIPMTSHDVTPCIALSWRHGIPVQVLVLWKLLNNRRAFPRAIRPVNLPSQSGISIVGSFLSHGRTDLRGGWIFLRISLYNLYELAGFNMI
jgi:hypothetical protein